MNLELLETFHQNFPEAADGHLERMKKDDGKDGGCATYTITLQFNRIGSLLAVGCNDGRVEIWDFVTRRIAKVLVAHTHPVCCLSWSRDSRRLLTASTDNLVSIWDVVTSDCVQTFRFPCPVLKAQFNARRPGQCLVCPMRHPPVMIDLATGAPTIIQSEEETDPSIVASYDWRGEYIYTGNSKARVCIYKTDTFELVSSFRPAASANAAVKSIEFSRRGNCFLLNCADRVIRVFNCEDALKANGAELEPNKKLKDLVTGSHWRKCCFSGDGEFICAGSMKQHAIYIWERSTGTLMKILQGQKGETLLDVVWHPLRPIIVSISNSVTKEQVSIWAQTQVQNWSAFAPDFKELDENVEYEERESEFDLEDEDKEIEEKKADEDEDVEVDVETLEPVSALLSSDEEAECEDILMFLTIAPDVDNPDDLSGGEESTDLVVGGKKVSDSPTGRRSNEPPSKQVKRKDSTSGAGANMVNINLPNAHTNEVHPLMGNRKPSTKSLIHDQSKQSTSGANQSASSLGYGAGPRKTGTRQRDRAKSRK